MLINQAEARKFQRRFLNSKVNPFTLAPPFALLAVFTHTHTHTQKLYNPQPFHDEDAHSLGVGEDESIVTSHSSLG